MDANLIKTLLEGNHSLVVDNGSVSCYDGKGLKDLLRLLDTAPEVLFGATVADKVVGKAAAALMIVGKVKEVYAHTVSAPAAEMLGMCGITLTYSSKVDYIQNSDATGWCPMEIACRDLDNPHDMHIAIKNKISELMQNRQNSKR